MRILFVFLVFPLITLFAKDLRGENEYRMVSKITQLDENVGIEKPTLIRIGRYIAQCKKRGLVKQNPRLPCEIEKSDVLGGYLIYPRSKDESIIGHGVFKVARKAILYRDKPEIVAVCTQHYSADHERDMYEQVRGIKGVARYLGFSGDSSSATFYFRYMPQGCLGKYLHDKNFFSDYQKLHIAKNLIIALSGVHKKGIVHRDIHSGNILLKKCPSGRWEACLIDFGSAFYAQDALSLRPQMRPNLNPPELLVQELSTVDRFKTDVYALGCLFHKLLWGSRNNVEEIYDVREISNYSAAERVKRYEKVGSCYKYSLLKYTKRGQKNRMEQFKVLVYEMLHYMPAKRPSMEEVSKRFARILPPRYNETK